MAAKAKNPHAVALGRRGGLVAAGAGARAQLAGLTSAEKSERMRRLVERRWAGLQKRKR